MAREVVDLTASVSGAEDSPNKAAKLALSDFAPRKDRWKTQSISKDHGYSGQDGSEFDSPGQAARSALDQFAPRKEGGPVRDGVLGVAGQDLRQKGQDQVKSRDHGHHDPVGKGHTESAQIRPPLANASRSVNAGPWNDSPDHAAHSHASLSITPPKVSSNAAMRLSPFSRPSGRTSKQRPSVEERAQRAEAYYKRYEEKKARDANSPPTARTQGATKADGSPSFVFPTVWTPTQQAKPGERASPTQPPLKIVDTFAKHETNGLDNSSEMPPLKKARLSAQTPSLGKGASMISVQMDIGSARLTRDGHSGIAREESDVRVFQTLPSVRRPSLSATPPNKTGSTPNGKTAGLVTSSPLTIASSRKRAKPFHLRHKMRLQPAIDDESEKRSSQVGLVMEVKARADHDSKSSLSKTATSPGMPPSAVPKASSKDLSLAVAPTSTSSFGVPYTSEEDELLAELKGVKQLSWEAMVPYSNGRTKNSLQFRYSSKVRKRHQQQQRQPALAKQVKILSKANHAEESSDSDARARRQRKARNNDASAASGMISWTEVAKRRRLVEAETSESSSAEPATMPHAQFLGERAHPVALSRTLRQRETGISARRRCKPVSDELKEYVFDDVGPLKYHKGTSGDVTCLAWSSDGRHFAAGSIAISDERSMQYNRPGNLVLGDTTHDRLRELPEHHLPRPTVAAQDNVNRLHAMQQTQDPRLFMTVATVQFSPDGRTLYSAGTDAYARAYDVAGGNAACAYEIKHDAPLDLLSVSNANILATACHQSEDGSIGIYKNGKKLLALSPTRVEQQTSRAIFPSALRWGLSHHHTNLLIAGFSIDSVDEERSIAGETCLWDVEYNKRIDLPVTRNVFDVAWNPRPTPTSTTFAVAGTPGTQKVAKGTRTVVQCFAPNQGRASRVLEWECPAFDINDIVYCQHDDNLIAAGATDGKVYVWDQRFRCRHAKPLHTFEHGDSLNVLDHDRPREIADTGVRFLSWGATGSRLYTGSSDGVVKIWNPYMAYENAHIKDVATFSSAVMSGAFSPDYRDLLIGEDQGRVNSLSVGHGEKTVRSMRKFDFVPAPAPAIQDDPRDAARELVRSQQVKIMPMGDLPTRQALQGPNYAGPYLVPPKEEIREAVRKYKEAKQAREEAKSRAELSDDEDFLMAADSAKEKLAETSAVVHEFKGRIEDGKVLHPQAEAFQRRLSQAGKQRQQLETLGEARHCKLDCNYLPARADDGNDVADSGRSEGRIPGNLRLLPPQDTALWTHDEFIEAGMKSKCISCFGAAAKPKAGLPLCDLCATTRRGFTAKCAECARPIRPEAESNLCEKCSFACFRCGGMARIAKDASRVECKKCELVWTAGVLGYELVSPKASCRENAVFFESEFGEDELERLAKRWGSTG